MQSNYVKIYETIINKSSNPTREMFEWFEESTNESVFGIEDFAEIWWNSLVKLLVEKGLITEAELLESFRREADRFLIDNNCSNKTNGED
jgi:hypothetical protein